MKFYFVLPFLCFISCQNSEYCSNISSTACDNLAVQAGNQALFKKDDPMVMYLTMITNHTANVNLRTKSTAQYFVKVDEYSSLTVQNCLYV